MNAEFFSIFNYPPHLFTPVLPISVLAALSPVIHIYSSQYSYTFLLVCGGGRPLSLRRAHEGQDRVGQPAVLAGVEISTVSACCFDSVHLGGGL